MRMRAAQPRALRTRPRAARFVSQATTTSSKLILTHRVNSSTADPAWQRKRLNLATAMVKDLMITLCSRDDCKVATKVIDSNPPTCTKCIDISTSLATALHNHMNNKGKEPRII